MAWKNLKQRSLADDLVSEHEALTELDDVNGLMDWQAIEDPLCDIHAKRRGNSAWPPLFIFKALLLQSEYTISDPALENQLAHDLLFWSFKQTLGRLSLMGKLLGEMECEGSLWRSA
jgi:IS5 family transposase